MKTCLEKHGIENAIDFIKEKVTIVELMQHYSFKDISYHGSAIRSACGLHSGDNPTAFVADIEKGLWFCHTKCNTGGDIFDLVMHMEHLDFMQAVNRIAEMFNLDIASMKIKIRTNKILQDTKRWIQMMRNMTDSKANNVFDISVLGELQSIKSYRNFNKETLEYFNVKYCLNNSRVIIPIYEDNQTIGVTMRRTTKHPAKWLHQPTGLKMANVLYNYENIEANKQLIICEGVFDVFSYWQNGFTNVVGTFGCHMSDEQQSLILKKTYDVILSYDNDSAGIEGTNRVIEELKHKVNIRVANMPEGYDPGMLSKEELDYALDNALKIYKWRDLNGKGNVRANNVSA